MHMWYIIVCVVSSKYVLIKYDAVIFNCSRISLELHEILIFDNHSQLQCKLIFELYIYYSEFVIMKILYFAILFIFRYKFIFLNETKKNFENFMHVYYLCIPCTSTESIFIKYANHFIYMQRSCTKENAC